MIVNVTEENIMNGIKRSASYCPIALAIRDKKYVFSTSVQTTIIYVHREIGKKVTMTMYEVPDEAKQFIRNFDNRIPIKPIKFTLKKKKQGGIL